MRLRFWNPREAAQEVLLHLGWTQEDGTPTRVFPFSALQYLEHRPTLPPAKRRAALWLTPQPECPPVPRPSPHFPMYRTRPDGQAYMRRKSARMTLTSISCLSSVLHKKQQGEYHLSKRLQEPLATCYVTAHPLVMGLLSGRLPGRSMRFTKKCLSWKKRLVNCSRKIILRTSAVRSVDIPRRLKQRKSPC